MPCYDHRNEPSYVRAEVTAEYRDKINKLTRLLCELCQCSEPDNWSPELNAWWKEHRKLDKRHEAEDAARKKTGKRK